MKSQFYNQSGVQRYMNKKRILIVTQYFYPENFRINDLALELKNRGYEISVLTGLPNYPNGEYFDGYTKNKNCDEIWNDIPIYRCKLRPRNKGSINLVRNYLSFIHEAKKKARELEDKNFDLIYVFEVSPITVALPAIKMKKERNIPIIMNVQDLWPENIIAITGIHNRFVIKAVKKLVKYIYKHCDLILTASESFVENIQSYLKTGQDKVHFWPQYAVVKKEEKKNNLFNTEDFNIVFTGNIGEAQGLDIVIEASRELRNTPIKWQLIGDGRNERKLKEKVKEYGLNDFVLFHGRKPEHEIPQYLANADAALLILKPDPVFEMTLPAKLQTYMACGVPIIGCVSGEGRRVIMKAEAGFVSDEISKSGLIKACHMFLQCNHEEYERLRSNSFSYGNQYFDKQKLINELISNIEILCN